MATVRKQTEEDEVCLTTS